MFPVRLQHLTELIGHSACGIPDPLQPVLDGFGLQSLQALGNLLEAEILGGDTEPLAQDIADTESIQSGVGPLLPGLGREGVASS